MIAFLIYGIGALLSLAATLVAAARQRSDREKVAVLAFGMGFALTWPIVGGALIYDGLKRNRDQATI